jgi:hypothetical protein
MQSEHETRTPSAVVGGRVGKEKSLLLDEPEAVLLCTTLEAQELEEDVCGIEDMPASVSKLCNVRWGQC